MLQYRCVPGACKPIERYLLRGGRTGRKEPKNEWHDFLPDLSSLPWLNPEEALQVKRGGRENAISGKGTETWTRTNIRGSGRSLECWSSSCVHTNGLKRGAKGSSQRALNTPLSSLDFNLRWFQTVVYKVLEVLEGVPEIHAAFY